MKRLAFLVVWMLLLFPSHGFAELPTADLISVKKIWDGAPHCAFTDLVYWKGQFVCAFREGRGHVAAGGKIRVLTSPDGNEWKSVALLDVMDYDLRDAGLSVMPDGRLMLSGGAAKRPKDGEHVPTDNFVSFSKDTITWTKPVAMVINKTGSWLWRVTWNKPTGPAFGVVYDGGSGVRHSSLVVTENGRDYKTLVPNLLDQGWPTEAVIRVDDHGTMYCLQRRDSKAPANTAMLGVSKEPYTEWEWHDLGEFFGGPNLIQMPGGDWIAAGRMMRDGKPKTVLAQLDVEKFKLKPILELPSGGDTSYPGLVLRGGILYVSYYSSHEGKAQIYLAKVSLHKDGKDANANQQAADLTADEVQVCDKLGLDKTVIAELLQKPLYKFSEQEVGTYLSFLEALEPGDRLLRKRIAHLARKNIGQPYELYLLGEAPYEKYDPQPIYCLGKSDCLVFTEHTYAMALSHDWPSFMRMLQRIRYRDGVLGVATRNHYTEADWNISNRWLVEDITNKIAGDKAVTFEQTIDRSKFLKNRYKLDSAIPVEDHKDTFLRFEDIDLAKGELQDGDFVNIVRGTVRKDAPESELSTTFGGNAWVGHTGIIVLGDYGEVHLLHSSVPTVQEEPIDEYIARSTKDLAAKDAKGTARLLGFKFLRLREHPRDNLSEIDGDAAPKVTLPDGHIADFDHPPAVKEQ